MYHIALLIERPLYRLFPSGNPLESLTATKQLAKARPNSLRELCLPADVK